MNKIFRAAAVALGLVLICTTKISAETKETYIKQEYVDLCIKYADEYDLCPEILEALIEVESGGKADAVSYGRHDCVGLCQINPKYSEYTREELFNPETSIKEAARILSEYSTKYEIADALCAYNCGENSKTFKHCIETGSMTKYAKKILKRSQELEELHYGL